MHSDVRKPMSIAKSSGSDINYRGLSKFVSLILRHHPEEVGVTLDEHGWAKVEDLISGINGDGWNITKADLDEVVYHASQNRFSYSKNGLFIRANHGHSVQGIDLGLGECEPPSVLYHGTAYSSVNSILAHGIYSMKRVYVHLSVSREAAREVGARHGSPVVLTVDAGRMYQDGIKFYKSVDGVYLVDYVNPKYVGAEGYVEFTG